MQEDTIELVTPKQPVLSPRELVFKYLRYLPWLIVSVGLMLSLAYIKLRYSTPIFSVSGKLLVKKNSNPYSGGGDKFDDIFMMQSSGNSLNDEIEIIKSRSMGARVARVLNLQTQFYNKGKIKDPSIVHPNDMPFVYEIRNQKDSTRGYSITITVVNDNDFHINESATIYHFNQFVELPIGTIRLFNTGKNIHLFSSNIFIVSYRPIESVAAWLSGGISVMPSGEYNSNVLTVGFQTENPRLGLDIVNHFMDEYQKASLEDKRQIATNTLAFIDTQARVVKVDLGTLERNLQLFREKNRLFAPEQQSLLFFNELSESNKALMDYGLKLKAVELLGNYISNQSTAHRIVGSTMGIAEPSLVQQVMEYNRLQLERETALKTAPAGNPAIKNLEAGIEVLRSDMQSNLQNIRNSFQQAIADIRRTSASADNEISQMPLKERQFLEVTRQEKILGELYSYLLQKKLETAISSASTISNIKVLEPALAGGAPILPKRGSLYFIFLMVGIALPVAIIFLLEYMNDKVRNKSDIERFTNAPVLGEVGHAEEGGALVVTSNTRHFIAEQFRIIRSNIQYILPKIEKPVMMVTSSFSGEGKSFISTNLGAVLAVSGKRTVILEFDIRKPKIMEGLGLNERRGITNYIVSNIPIRDIIYPVPEVENLFVIPCGPVPPNPSEMLLDEKVKTLFDQLKKEFDVIIVDTAPVGLVSDALSLAKYVNASMYIVRHNYTFKKQVQLINELYVNKKLPHLAIIINDLNTKTGYGSYYGYGNYGYGYGSYGYGYFDVKGKRPGGLLSRLKRLFS